MIERSSNKHPLRRKLGLDMLDSCRNSLAIAICERDAAFDAGLEAAALYHDGEAERIRQICRPLTLKQIDAIGEHDEAAIAIRAFKRNAK